MEESNEKNWKTEKHGWQSVPAARFAHLVDELPRPRREVQTGKAFASQIGESGDSEYLFPSTREGTERPHIQHVRKLWNRTLERAGLPNFSLYELRHTFATRLSAGGVADHFVTQMLRQGESGVFKRYSQAKLGMMCKALAKLDRQANERGGTSLTTVAS